MDTETRSSAWGAPVVLAIAGVLVLGVLYFAPRSSQRLSQVTPSPAVSPSPAIAGIVDNRVDVAVEADDPVLGDAAAPITIIEFSEFECPACRQFHRDTFPHLQQRYIDTGRIKYVFKDLPLSQIHPQALMAAEAAQCARVQGKFWEYAEVLFAAEAALAPTDLAAYAAGAELDVPAFTQCVEKHEQADKVTKNVQAAIAAGLTGTPSFVINGQLLEGSLPPAAFERAINEAVKGQP